MRLKIRVTPRAKKKRIRKADDGTIKVYLSSPPLDGKANKELITTLAKVFSIPKSSIIIISGETGRDKVLEIPDGTDITGLDI